MDKDIKMKLRLKLTYALNAIVSYNYYNSLYLDSLVSQKMYQLTHSFIHLLPLTWGAGVYPSFPVLSDTEGNLITDRYLSNHHLQI